MFIVIVYLNYLNDNDLFVYLAMFVVAASTCYCTAILVQFNCFSYVHISFGVFPRCTFHTFIDTFPKFLLTYSSLAVIELCRFISRWMPPQEIHGCSTPTNNLWRQQYTSEIPSRPKFAVTNFSKARNLHSN